MKILLIVFAAVLGLALPELALAQNVAPAGLTHWDLYVFGNGVVVREILTGVALLMGGGATGFKSLLLFMATLGFLVLAIGAGFDPSKNLIKLFSYILIAWAVTYLSTGLKSNVVILDMVPNATGATPADEVLSDIPAIVVIPAAVTSKIGLTLTKQMETYFSTIVGPEFTIVGGGGGQFNLFNRMVEESGQFIISNPELKKTISAYTANCVVPAIARGALTSDALLNSVDYVATLEAATHNAIMTQYYVQPSTGTNDQGSADHNNVASLAGMNSSEINAARGMGVMLSCQKAYDLMKVDLSNYANELVGRGTSAWAKTGTLVPFEHAYNTMLSKAAAGGSVAAGFSSANGYILQQAMINGMAGNFRQAAVQTGNNEIMQAAAISQAEQQQKSSWVAGFQVFNNMVGYVFTVLQSLIYAMTPIIVVAMLIPGMGMKIFVNYAQVLVWLTLWTPMLAIVNFIITVFGSDAFAESIGLSGGLTAKNKGLVSERANDLIVAAQFMGTMVPMFTWGIVKGAMAFTEFISAGVGSEFSKQAGAAAATGNLSMNNLSLNNTGVDQYKTMMSSAVGYQGVSVGSNAGAMTLSADQGGSNVMRNASAVISTTAAQRQLSSNAQEGEQVSRMMSEAQTKGYTSSEVLARAAKAEKGSAEQKAWSQVLSKAHQASTQSSAGESEAWTERVVAAAQAQIQRSTQSSLAGNISGGGGFDVVVKFSGKGAFNHERAWGDSRNVSKQDSEDAARVLSLEKDKIGLSEGASKSSGKTVTNQGSESNSTGTTVSKDFNTAIGQAISEVGQAGKTYSETMSAMVAEMKSFSYNDEMDFQRYDTLRKEADLARTKFLGADQIASNMKKERTNFQANHDNRENTIGKKRAESSREFARMSKQSNALSGPSAEVAKDVAEVDSDISRRKGVFNEREGKIVESKSAVQRQADNLDKKVTNNDDIRKGHDPQARNTEEETVVTRILNSIPGAAAEPGSKPVSQKISK